MALGVAQARGFVAQARDVVMGLYPDAAPSAEHDWHVTLLFIGCVPVRAVAGLVRTLAEVAEHSRAFPIGFGRLGAFPSARRPGLVYLAPIQIGQEAARLHRRLAVAVRTHEWASGLPGGFEPHVTLARLARPGPALASWEVAGPKWQVESFALMETVSLHGPSRYVERQAFPLRDRDLIE